MLSIFSGDCDLTLIYSTFRQACAFSTTAKELDDFLSLLPLASPYSCVC